MRLKEVTVSGYKSYGKMYDSVKLGDRNIIIGANGAGKSNFISFLEMISHIATDDFEDYVARNGYAESILHSRLDMIDHIEGDLIFEDRAVTDEYIVEISQGSSGSLYISREKIRYQTTQKDKPYERDYKSGGKRSALIEESAVNETARIMLNILKGCRIFHFNDTSMNSRMRMPVYVRDDRFLRADGGNLAAYLYALKNNTHLSAYYARIENMIREVFPRFKGFSLHSHVVEGGEEKILLNWKEKGCDAVFGPHMFSDGTLRFIGLCALLLGPENGKPDIIIMDEPEIGLHPYAVKVLSEMIRMASQSTQIIIATQSRDLLNEFSADDVIISEFDEINETSTLKRLKTESLNDWLEDYSLAELWDKNVLGGMP